MKIAVVGLGLIGGSFCRAIKKNTRHMCLGMDTDKDSISAAIKEGVIDCEIGTKQLGEADLTIVCLHPQKTIEFLKNNASGFRKGTIVMDSCGIKGEVVSEAADELKARGIVFIPAHPMAGTENSGFGYSNEELFSGASFIVTPGPEVTEESLSVVKQLVLSIGFRELVVSTPDEHDRIIALTSQLAHIVSSSYIKSPTAQYQAGFSAGSFKDMTRVAKLNENMWTELFMMNRENLIFEIESIVNNLQNYEKALQEENCEELTKLLRDGRILKEESLRNQAT